MAGSDGAEYLTAAEVARSLRASAGQVRRWLRAGKLQGVRRGDTGRWLVEAASVRQFLGRDDGEAAVATADEATVRLRKKGYAV